MQGLFYKMPCQSVSKEFKNQEIYESLFDKRVDKRYLESAVQRFISLNRKMFNFLGIVVNLTGTDNALTLSFSTSNLIGAIPLKMPYDGIVHKDFQVIPRFDSGKDIYAELTQLLDCLDYSIKPEYSDENILLLPTQLRPPLYYEAVKYLEHFEKAYNYAWVKFDIREKIHSYPKTGTNWTKYALRSYNPQNALLFSSRDSVLNTNHKEWQELKYVFELAKEQILNPRVPGIIRFKYAQKIRQLSNKVDEIKLLPTDELVIHSSDPQCIKNAKLQGNIVLNKTSNGCAAWRMDMAELFERYVQYIVTCGTRELSGMVVTNGKIAGRGKMQSWGLRNLEPDIMVKIGNCVYVADAKYKANFYAQETKTDVLKETHRADLHQLLAYCSFEPQSPKAGILFYPSSEMRYWHVDYTDRIGGVCNKVILCGVPFSVADISKTADEIKSLFQSEILASG